MGMRWNPDGGWARFEKRGAKAQSGDEYALDPGSLLDIHSARLELALGSPAGTIGRGRFDR